MQGEIFLFQREQDARQRKDKDGKVGKQAKLLIHEGSGKAQKRQIFEGNLPRVRLIRGRIERSPKDQVVGFKKQKQRNNRQQIRDIAPDVVQPILSVEAQEQKGEQHYFDQSK